MAKRRYVGIFKEVMTVLDGRSHLLARRDIVDVSEETAKRLDTDPETWAPITEPKGATENTNEDDEVK
jgi:hypothetical protein